MGVSVEIGIGDAAQAALHARFGIPAQIIGDERAAGDHLAVLVADFPDGTFDQSRGDAAPA